MRNSSATNTYWSSVKLIGLILLASIFGIQPVISADTPAVRQLQDGTLEYAADEAGNRIPDFSNCGYQSGNADIPDVPAAVVVTPSDGDDGARIQAAIDYVSQLPLQENGFRGAVQLLAGTFQTEQQLCIRASGVVLRGAGALEGGTQLISTGLDRVPLIEIEGSDDRTWKQEHTIEDKYSPVGAREFQVKDTSTFSVGDTVVIERPCTKEWIDSLNTQGLIGSWKPDTRAIRWDRTITKVSSNSIEVDAPITTAIDQEYGSGTVRAYLWSGRIENVGVESISLEAQVSSDNPKDEDHAWWGVRLASAKNAWVRRVHYSKFAGGAVHVGRSAKSVTVEDCISQNPISEIAGYRRNTFFCLGQLALFNRCWSEQGIHDYAVGASTAGPVAFVQCRTKGSLGPSGPIESWASGILYDNVRIDGNNLELKNRWNSPPGTGWAAANSVIWQCRAANVLCFRPPGGINWAIGNWATHSGDGKIESVSDFVRPFSLYQAQLRRRRGDEAAKRIDPLIGRSRAATRPSLAEAAEFVAQSSKPATTLLDVIEESMRASGAQTTNTNALSSIKSIDDVNATSAVDHTELSKNSNSKVAIENGWLVSDSAVITGKRLIPSWWRGVIREAEARVFGHNISRFAPGRRGPGLTETPQEIASDLRRRGYAAYQHHYGLWYERRRDDHLMVRRADGDVAPPFYEQPFARSGTGTAWDGLSKYDLTKYNKWYWNRLAEFSGLLEQNGMVLFHQNYFQHNILEAGAHWVDCPWRPTNNINDVELPEPPPYIGDKRIFMAENFYDFSRPNLRALHRAYIRQCLDNFGERSNVIQMTSAEFTGPLSFVEFWLDTIIEWKQDNNGQVIVALSCPKDVQDAILADTQRAPHVDVIDIRYWTYAGDGELYAPKGGLNLAPRQHLRKTRARAANFDSIVKAVREYRLKHPEKAVIYNADRCCRSINDGWAVLMGGGSLADVRLPNELANQIPKMRPMASDASSTIVLRSSTDEFLIRATADGKTVDLTSILPPQAFKCRWLDPKTGSVAETDDLPTTLLDQVPTGTGILWLSSE